MGDARLRVTADPAPATKTLTCPNCGGAIAIRAAGHTVTLVCRYCSSLIDVANPDARLIAAYNEAALDLAIPLGTRGTLRGTEWEAIGFVQRSDSGIGWSEYLLFNPYAGYAWLITDGRGWSFGRLLTATPREAGGAIVLDGQRYKPFFAGGTARVDYVLGEFYWRVQVGERVRTADYVRPGFMLSREANDAEKTWTLAELLDPREVTQAFGVDRPTPWPASGRPPMPHQPSPYGGMIGRAWKFALIAIAALFVLALVFGRSGAVLTETVTIAPEGERSATIGPIVLTRAKQPVTIRARSDDVSNQWVDLDYALVDRATQASFEAYGIVERYNGRDADGAWSEGDRSAATKIAAVPAGTYDLVVDFGAHNWTGAGSDFAAGSAPVQVTVAVAAGGIFWSNLLIAILLLLAPLLVLTWRAIQFEAARTGESDFGGGASSSDGDKD